jgi:hypothetical protein
MIILCIVLYDKQTESSAWTGALWDAKDSKSKAIPLTGRRGP